MGSHSLNSHFGAVVNPLNPLLSTGGSSGGSAASVAASITPLAIGTDTGGSVRLPASYTRTVGFKPSYGLISRWGVVAYANSLDTVGILSTRWRDARTLFSILAHHDPRDPTSVPRPSPRPRPNRPLRVGVPREYNLIELTSSARETWERTLSHLASKGAEIVPLSMPNTKHALSAYYILAPAEASSNLARYDGFRYGNRSDVDREGGILWAATRKQGLGDEVRKRILVGAYSLSSAGMEGYFRKAQKVRRLVKGDFDGVFEGVDVVIAPAALGGAPEVVEVKREGGVEGYVNDVLTVPASLAGVPSLTVPVRGSEVGMQVMGGWGREEDVWWAAEELEGLVDA